MSEVIFIYLQTNSDVQYFPNIIISIAYFSRVKMFIFIRGLLSMFNEFEAKNQPGMPSDKVKFAPFICVNN